MPYAILLNLPCLTCTISCRLLKSSFHHHLKAVVPARFSLVLEQKEHQMITPGHDTNITAVYTIKQKTHAHLSASTIKHSKSISLNSVDLKIGTLSTGSRVSDEELSVELIS